MVYSAEDRAQFIDTPYVGYLGVCKCPKCGKRGYARVRKRTNNKTLKDYGLRVTVEHRVGSWGTQRYDYTCYINMDMLRNLGCLFEEQEFGNAVAKF